jgi:hypothetical protein
LIIIQIKEETKFSVISSHEKLSEIFRTNILYENGKRISEQTKFEKGDHFLRYYSRLKGGLMERWGIEEEQIKEA